MIKLEKENAKLAKWFDDTVVEDQEDCITIATTAMEECRKRWNVGFDTPAAVLGFYAVTYESILRKLVEKRVDSSKFAINVANIVEIGYDDLADDGESEKIGNFCPFIYDIGEKIEYNEDPDLLTLERCTEWVSKNVTEQKKTLNDIATDTVKHLAEDVDIHLSESPVVFPIFCTIHEQLVGYMKVKLADTGKSEEMINFVGCFDIYCRKVEDGKTVIEYSPQPSQKLTVKSDAIATAPTEE